MFAEGAITIIRQPANTYFWRYYLRPRWDNQNSVLLEMFWPSSDIQHTYFGRYYLRPTWDKQEMCVLEVLRPSPDNQKISVLRTSDNQKLRVVDVLRTSDNRNIQNTCFWWYSTHIIRILEILRTSNIQKLPMLEVHVLRTSDNNELRVAVPAGGNWSGERTNLIDYYDVTITKLSNINIDIVILLCKFTK